MNEEDNNNSELEAFFKNRLNTNETAGDGWDNPPDSVLDNAFQILDEKKKKRFGFLWFWTILGVVSVALLSTTIWNMNRLNQIDDKLTSLIENDKANKSIITSSASDSTVQKETSKTSITTTDLPTVPVQKETTPIQNKKPRGGKRTNVVLPEDNANLKATKEVEQSQSIERITIYETNIPEPNVNSRLNTMELSDPTVQDSIKPILPFVVAQIVESQNEEEEEDMDLNQVYFFLGGNASSLSMTANNPLPTNLTRYDNWYAGYQLGAGLTHRLKSTKWSVDMRIQYQLYRNSSIFEDEAQYSKANESVSSSGESIYTAPIGLESPIRKFEGALSFDLQNQTFPNGSLLNNSTAITNTFHTTAAYVGLGYGLYSNTKWELQGRFGVSANYAIEMKQEMAFEMKRNTSVLATETFEEVSTKQMTKLYGSGLVGLKLSRSIHKNMTLGLSTAYTRSLQSIRQVEGPEQVKTQVSMIQSSVVVGLKF